MTAVRVTKVKTEQVTNIVKRFSPPTGMLRGEITFSRSLFGYPSCGFLFKSVQNRTSIMDDYREGSRFTFNKIPFVVRGVGSQKSIFYIDDEAYTLWDVQVEGEYFYQSRIEEEVSLAKFPANRSEIKVSEIADLANVPFKGSSFSIPLGDRSSSSTISLSSVLEEVALIEGGWVEYGATVKIKRSGSSHQVQWMTSDVYPFETERVRPFYRGAELSWGGQPDEEEETETELGIELELKEPKQETTVTMDENFDFPPIGTEVLRGIDSNANASGETKEKILDVTIDGKPLTKEIFINGFAYLARDIATPDEELFSVNPAAFWQLVEYQKHEYIYSKIASVSFSARAINPETEERVDLIVDPDYESLMSVTLGGMIVIRATAQYLTEIRITGWKLLPIAKEESSGEFYSLLYTPGTTDPEEQAILDTLQFRQVPIVGKTQYLLKSMRSVKRNQNSNEENNPFSVQWLEVETLGDRFLNRIPQSAITKNKQVGVISLNSSYVEPFYIAEERKTINSFAWSPHPIEDDPPAPPLTVGEITDDVIKRTLTKDGYSEYSKSFSSSSSGFLDSYREGRTVTSTGSPPQAEVLVEQWETKERAKSKIPDDQNPEKQSRYFLYSSGKGEGAAITGNKSYGLAETLQQAKKAAKTDLWRETLKASSSSRTLAWYYPRIAPGDRISASFDTSGSWIVQDMSFRLTVDGDAVDDIVQCEGTEISCAIDKEVSVTVKQVAISTEGGSGDSPNFEIQVEYQQGQATLGEIDLLVPHRRRF